MDTKGLKRVKTNRHGPNPITSPYVQNCPQGLTIQVRYPGLRDPLVLSFLLNVETIFGSSQKALAIWTNCVKR